MEQKSYGITSEGFSDAIPIFLISFSGRGDYPDKYKLKKEMLRAYIADNQLRMM